MNQAREQEKRDEIQHAGRDVGSHLRDRVEHVRDIVEDVRDRAEIAFREKPYLLPVATGVLGFGVGVLFGSKLARFIVFTAAGAMLSETLGGEIKRLSREFMTDFQERLRDEEHDGAHADG
jgi:hypothetical protein